MSEDQIKKFLVEIQKNKNLLDQVLSVGTADEIAKIANDSEPNPLPAPVIRTVCFSIGKFIIFFSKQNYSLFLFDFKSNIFLFKDSISYFSINRFFSCDFNHINDNQLFTLFFKPVKDL